MLYQIPMSETARIEQVTYEFLEPVQVRIRKPDGSTVLMGYGIGERIVVLEPQSIIMTPPRERVTVISLVDGSSIIEFPENMRVNRVYN